MGIEVDVILDTNILLRTPFDKPTEQTEASRAWMRLGELGHAVGTTVSNLTEFASVASRPISSNGLGLTQSQVQKRIALFEKHLVVYSESIESYQIWKQLVSTYDVLGKTVHDARIVSVMLHSQLPAILTLNVSDFIRFREITVLHPRDVLESQSY